VVYVSSDDGNLYAFNASGCGATSCQALVKVSVGAPVETSPAVANGQVFVTDTAGTLHAYGLPASGS
jgi:outer membrane protein assembly factor BamB